jgi:hypothetical protein
MGPGKSCGALIAASAQVSNNEIPQNDMGVLQAGNRLEITARKPPMAWRSAFGVHSQPEVDGEGCYRDCGGNELNRDIR